MADEAAPLATRAVRITEPGGPAVLELQPLELPPPGPGEVVLRVRAAGVNRADLLQRRGLYPAPADALQDVPGLEVAGEVERLGPGVRGVAEGERVMALLPGGGYAERAVVPAALLLPIPERLSFAEAAAFPEVFYTAHDAFLQAELKAGERVLVHAAGGGVGTAALQLARLAACSLIIGTASRPKLEAIARAGLPLDVGIDYNRGGFADLVLERTGGKGADVILDGVGASYWHDNLRSLATCGRLVVIGLLGGSRVELELGVLMTRRARVIGTVLRSRSLAEKASLTERVRTDLLPPLERGEIGPVLDRCYPLAEAAAAHRYMEENLNVGKIVLEAD